MIQLEWRFREDKEEWRLLNEKEPLNEVRKRTIN